MYTHTLKPLLNNSYGSSGALCQPSAPPQYYTVVCHETGHHAGILLHSLINEF